ncbi:unnamed protein product, partial [Phaeothamnion confervicola]
MLDAACAGLMRAGRRYVRFDGEMSQQQRESALRAFAAAAGPPILLVSLKAGGVGLNLTA